MSRKKRSKVLRDFLRTLLKLGLLGRKRDWRKDLSIREYKSAKNLARQK